MTGRRSHGRLSALNGVVHQGSFELELLNLGILSRKIEIEWHAFLGLEGSLPRGESPDQREIIAPVHRPGLNIARRSFMSKNR